MANINRTLHVEHYPNLYQYLECINKNHEKFDVRIVN